MKEKATVRVGQLWQDCDKRIGVARTLRVLVVLSEQALCQVFRAGKATGRKTYISLGRFRPNSTGYRLLEEPK